MEQQVYLQTVVSFGIKQQYNYFFVIYNEYCILQTIFQNDSDNDTETESETCLTDVMPPFSLNDEIEWKWYLNGGKRGISKINNNMGMQSLIRLIWPWVGVNK